MKKKLIKIGVTIAVVGSLFFIIIIISTIASIMAAFNQNKAYDIPMENLPSMITEEMIIGAIESQEKYGVPASLTLAQIILESSGSYEGGLSQLAFECKNLFGMKGTGPAGSVTYNTAEYSGTQAFFVNAQFRKYHSFKESIDDHGALLTTNRYKTHTAEAKTADDWAKGIANAGYATDPAYANTLISLMTKYGLYQYDSLKLRRKSDGTASGILGWPLSIPGTLTSPFGYRGDIGVVGATAFHEGQDIAGPSGTPILASDGGTVIFTGWYGSGGNAIKIDHGDGVITEYLHLNASGGIMVSVGQTVSKGEQIGRMGTTGASSGYHLHFGVRIDGKLVDPMEYVAQP